MLAVVLALTLAFSAEVPISPAELAPSRLTLDSHIATNGELYVAVWTDIRSDPTTTYAARLRPDGTLLDRVGIRVAPNSQAGAVIWSGRAFLITYLEEGMVKVRTLSPDGLLGDPIDLFGNYVLANVYRMRMATNGSTVLLVTSDATAAILDLDGHELRQISFPWLWAQNGFGVAAAGSTYLVAAATHDQYLKTQIVTNDGDFGASQTLMDTVNYGADVASDGERFLVTWARGNLYAQFLTRDGAPAQPQIALTAVDPVYFYSHAVIRLVRRADEYLLVYSTYRGAPFDTMRIGSNGEKRGALLTGFNGPLNDLVVANGHGAVIGYDRELLSAAFFDASAPAPLRNSTPVSIAARPQSNVRLARIDGGFVSAWRVDTVVPELWLSRGAGSTPVRVATGSVKLIDVVVESGAVWVVWQKEESGNVYTRRFTSALQPIDAEPVFVATIQSWDQDNDSSVAAGGGAVLMVHTKPHDALDFEPEGPHVEAYVLNATVNGIDVKRVGVASEPGRDRVPSVAWDGSAFAIAWANATGFYIPGGAISTHDRSYVIKPDDRILMMRMNAAGTLLDASPIEIARSKHVDVLAVSSGARGTAVAWQTYMTPDRTTSLRHIYAALAASNATVADLGGDGEPFLGALAATGDGFVLTRAAVLDPRTLQPEVLALDASLRVASREALPPISVNSFPADVNPYDVDLVAGTIAYWRIAGGSYGHVQRVFTRRIDDTQRRRAVR